MLIFDRLGDKTIKGHGMTDVEKARKALAHLDWKPYLTVSETGYFTVKSNNGRQGDIVVATLKKAFAEPAAQPVKNAPRSTYGSTSYVRDTRILVAVGTAAPETFEGKKLSGEGKIFFLDGDNADDSIFGIKHSYMGGKVRYAYYK